MSTYAVYSIPLRLIGEMSQLPDSQKVFGALCHAYADCVSAEEVSEFVSGVKNRSIAFSLSNVMPKGLLPVPRSFILRKHAGGEKELYQELKKRDFASKETIISLVKNPKELMKTGNRMKKARYASVKLSQQVHTNTEPSKSEPFSVLRSVCRIYQNEKEPTIACDFEFYLRCDVENAHCKKIIAILKAGFLFTFGRRSSQGYNLFEVTERPKLISDGLFSDGDCTVYLNLGMLLPDDINYSFPSRSGVKSSLDLFTSERRPYAPSSWNEGGHQGWFISFVAPGSIVVVSPNTPMAEITRCTFCKTADGADDVNRIVFGNALLLPFEGGV